MSKALTEVRLLAVPLESDYLHTFYFSDVSAQTSYFAGKTVKSMSNCTYQRKDKIIRYDGVYDDIIGCNYVMYKNSDYSSKWYYAFITKIEFVSEGKTNIYIETDVIQTWLFDYTVRTSFVEREHVNDDTVGLHTVPENIETGEYVVNGSNSNSSLTINTSIIIGTTINFNDADFKIFNVNEVKEFNNTSGGVYNGVFSGVKYFKLSKTQAIDLLKTVANTGQSDAIVSVFVAPDSYIQARKPDDGDYYELTDGSSVNSKEWVTDHNTLDVENLKPTHLNGYVPKNNKLFTYPYCYMLMDNNAGSSAIYQYELFNDPDNEKRCPFKIIASVTPGMSIRLIPKHYKGVDINDVEGLNLGKFPVCSWSNDVYTNWLTQNSVNIGLSVVGGITSTIIGVGSVLAAPATAGASLGLAGAVGVAGSVAGGIGAIGSTLGSVYQHSFQPPQAQGNTNAGDVIFSNNRTTFTAYKMTIKDEYARIIDGYFNMFGYKVTRVKTPNKNHRANYWYTKTIDVNIDGNIPVEDIQKIKNCYNNGITFWKNPANIQNYNVDNSIV